MMTLKELANIVRAEATGPLDLPVSDIAYDSRRVSPGSVFVAIRGLKQDGNRFIGDAMSRGAVGIISEAPRPLEFSRAWLRVPDARRALAEAAAAFYHHPSREMKVIGVTGTNGKTTTTYLLASILRAAGQPVARLGTTSYQIGDEEVPADRTTPEAPDIQRFLRRAAEAGCRYGVVEVSSHALELQRVYGCEFAAAVFTNLTPDHLDFHGTMDAYFAAKRKLFDGTTGRPPALAVINVDDPWGRRLRDIVQGPVVTYGLASPADISVSRWEMSFSGTTVTLRTPMGEVMMRSPLLGRWNVYNVVAAAATVVGLGLPLDDVAGGVEVCESVPGRFELVRLSDRSVPFLVIVDYAHTEDALRNLLETARGLSPRRLLTVFGCGGDRDRTKRAPMGAVAGRLSDLVIVTSDNPRSEDPEAIMAEIEVGLKPTGTPYLMIVDRREAIERAVAEARPGDIVILAGKGHETEQVFADRTIPFDDREVARAALRKRFGPSEQDTGTSREGELAAVVCAVVLGFLERGI